MPKLQLTKIIYDTESERSRNAPVISLFVDSCTDTDLVFDSKDDFVMKLGKNTMNNKLAWNLFQLGYNVNAYCSRYPTIRSSIQINNDGTYCYFNVDDWDDSVLDSKWIQLFTSENTFSVELLFYENMKYGDYILLNDSKFIYCLWYGTENDKVCPADPTYFNKDFRIDNDKETILQKLESLGARVYRDEANICYSFPLMHKPLPQYHIDGEMERNLTKDIPYNIFKRGNNDRMTQISNANRNVRIWSKYCRDTEDISVNIQYMQNDIYYIQVSITNDYGSVQEYFTESKDKIISIINETSNIIQIEQYGESLVEGEFTLGFNYNNKPMRIESKFYPLEDTFIEIKNNKSVVNKDCIVFSESPIQNVKYNVITNGRVDGYPLVYYYLVLISKGFLTGKIESYKVSPSTITDDIRYNTIFNDNMNNYIETFKGIDKNGKIIKMAKPFLEELLSKYIAGSIEIFDDIKSYLKDMMPIINDVKITDTKEDLEAETTTYNIELTYRMFENIETIPMTLNIIKRQQKAGEE